MKTIYNIENCKRILQINENESLTHDLIRRQYKINALKFHPDKNKDPDAREKFEQIQSAYEYLDKNIHYKNMKFILNVIDISI